MTKYGWRSEDAARKHVTVYDGDYHELLDDKNVEAVVIALPLHLHAPVAIEAMRAGKHVITEKLMAHSVHECKDMGRVAHQTDKILAVGHQRHYSILYDNAVDTIRSGLIGQIHSIRAQWHRDNLPGHDSWQPPLPNEVVGELEKLKRDRDKIAAELQALSETRRARDREKGARIDALTKKIDQMTAQVADRTVDAVKYGYRDFKLDPESTARPAIEELIRWRLWNRTGGGLMAELGSHQLDAAGIFISGLRKDGQKALPLNVSALGHRNIFPLDRECEDHVYCIYEFPGPDYDAALPNPNSKIGVMYSSINGNGFGGYGETVLGTTGTLILEKEQEVMLFKNASTMTSVAVKKKKDGGPTLDTTESNAGPAAIGKAALETGPISRGYTEELEHWAWCIRNPSPENLPRCHPKIALGDAVIALTTNIAIHENRHIDFEHAWFDIDQDATPEGVKPSVKANAPTSSSAKLSG
jgi:predicted dehydrogenase